MLGTQTSQRGEVPYRSAHKISGVLTHPSLQCWSAEQEFATMDDSFVIDVQFVKLGIVVVLNHVQDRE